ncbi:MAG: SDR family NAD(P)-dependent oxidoreductase [Pseudomonadales bacterium]|jgi:NAD(P)-dependent dehydrogenase (short-subunit alcohol dehydrogenase family)|tara:strand:- start:154 stop:1059 length:906 start_codon:yes stop_codon:yes gene_type:complete
MTSEKTSQNATQPSTRLAGKTAVITGGASGMGRSTALRFLAEGANVVVADFNQATGATLMQETEALGFAGRIIFIATDVALENDVEAALVLAVDTFGQLDIVFNNAGVGGAIGPLTETTTASWDYTMDVLAKGVFLGIKHAARIMRSQGTGGSIINTASIAALSGDAGPLVYSAAKAAVVSMTKSAAVELAQDRIRVNAICPGFIATPLADGGKPEKIREIFSRSQPWPEYGRGDHIAGAALFFASDDSIFVTGDALVVDGGLTAAGPELSRKMPRTSGRNSKVAGVTKGSTGEKPELNTF